MGERSQKAHQDGRGGASFAIGGHLAYTCAKKGGLDERSCLRTPASERVLLILLLLLGQCRVPALTFDDVGKGIHGRNGAASGLSRAKYRIGDQGERSLMTVSKSVGAP